MSYQDTLTGDNKDNRNLAGTFQIAVAALAAGVGGALLIGVAPFKGKVKSVDFYPNGLITGANTNTRLQRVYNRKADNSGTTVVASLQYDAGVNAPAKVKKSLALSGTPANLVVAAGDVLEFDSSAVGTGIADTGGVVVVKLERSV